eukprot:15450550-Alexandrium_andersonii.AAC.1
MTAMRTVSPMTIQTVSLPRGLRSPGHPEKSLHRVCRPVSSAGSASAQKVVQSATLQSVG